MTTYKPRFICKYCSQDLASDTYDTTGGYVGPCGCDASREAQELEHHVLIEQRKQARRRIR